MPPGLIEVEDRRAEAPSNQGDTRMLRPVQAEESRSAVGAGSRST